MMKDYVVIIILVNLYSCAVWHCWHRNIYYLNAENYNFNETSRLSYVRCAQLQLRENNAFSVFAIAVE